MLPAIHPSDDVPPLRGLVCGWTPAALAQRTAPTLYRWSPAGAKNVTIELHREPSDVLVANFALLGALAGTAFDTPPNARLEAFVPHGAVLPHAAALVTQRGWWHGALGSASTALRQSGRFVERFGRW